MKAADKAAAAVELKEVYKKIATHYWQVTRSARMGKWPSELYRRAALEQIIYGQIIS